MFGGDKFMFDMTRKGEINAFSGDYDVPTGTFFRHDLAFGDSSPNGSWASSSLPSSFSNGFGSSHEDGFYSPFSTLRFKKNINVCDGLLADDDLDLDLSQNLCKMSLSGEEKKRFGQMSPFETGPDGSGSRSLNGFLGLNGNVNRNVEKCHLYDRLYDDVVFAHDGRRCLPHEVSLDDRDGDASRFLGLQDEYYPKGFRTIDHNLSMTNDSCFNLGWYSNHRDYLLEQQGKRDVRCWSDSGIQLQDQWKSVSPYLSDASLPSQQCGVGFDGGRRLSSSETMLQPNLAFNVNNVSSSWSLLTERSTVMADNRVPQSLLPVEGAGNVGASTCEDSLIIQGTNLKLAINNSGNRLKGPKNQPCNEIQTLEQDIKLKDNLDQEGVELLQSLASMAEIYGSVHLMAKDQNGCRFLQKIFEKGSVLDVVIIFNEVIDHIIELMMDPFGNYFVQKLFDVCNEEQRTRVLFMVASKPGQLVKISLNTYGTRVVQKLIETLRTSQQISLVKSALKQGFLALVRDLNGNHVIQRCLQCLSPEVNKFIFDAATKFCVEIGTHRHGCCVLQRCVSHSSGAQQDKLITEISRNCLLLAQDPFGNYVVQYIIELKFPSATAVANMLSQFRGHYLQLSTQKFSSHVVEKCLKHYPESRAQIIRELLSSPHFEQLLQDPFANYVIQSALSVTKGSLRACLVEAVQAHAKLRTSPYCKRIFSKNLLKK